MTKDPTNAIMFAYRYDNLPILKSLYKQMIGDIAIMRNPWPIFSIAALSGAACLIYDHFFSYETMWIAVVAFLVLLALCFFAYCKYERWLAKKLNPYVVAYQSDHNLEKLKQGLNHWRPWAFSKHSQNIITANWFSALLEQKRWAEAEETLEQFLRRAKNTQDSAGNIDINRTVDDDEIAVYKVMLDDDYTAITLASDNIFEYKDYQPQEVKEQVSDEKIAAYKDTTKAEMEPYAQDFNAIIEGYEENMVVGFYSEGTVWGEEVGEYKAIAGTPLASDVSLYIAEDTTGQLYCIANQILNEDGTVSTAIELEEGDQVKVWGYASQYLELQEGLKIVVVQPGIIERNGELVILDENLKAD